MKVKSNVNIPFNLTKDKEYMVLQTYFEQYKIENDKRIKEFYPIKYFQNIESESN